MIHSQTLPLYKDWLKVATEEQIDFVDAVYVMCEAHYEDGGDTIVECFGPRDILDRFESLDQVKANCKIKVEQALNARWGEDTDPELETYRRSQEWI